MLTATKSLLNLTAADVMSTSVVTIPEAMSLQGAARFLSEFSITGAPVVDASGKCVGVLSASDFVAWADRGRYAAKDCRDYPGCAHTAWQLLETDELPREEVRQYMTRDAVTVAPSVPIGELARKMIDAHIHRLIVVDEADHPVGIVSTIDVMAALAEAHEHARSWDSP